MGHRSGLRLSGGALVSLTAALGALVGLRGVTALEWPGVRGLLLLPPVPREDLGMTWSARARWPTDLQDVSLERLSGILMGLFLAAAFVALLNALILLFEAGASRRKEAALRAAVGAAPRRVAALLLSSVQRLITVAWVLGLLLGLAGGLLLRWSWPGSLAALGWAGAVSNVLTGLLGLTLVSVGVYLWTGVRVARGRGLATALASGERVEAAPGEAFARRLLAALQVGVAGAVALGGIALARGAQGSPGASVEGATVRVAGVSVTGAAGRDWSRLLLRLGEIPGLEAESLATPGALLGLGVRDYTTAQCGNCYRGGLPLPFWGALADHHAVGPEYFELVGHAVVEGRGITWEDLEGTEPVAVVNRTFANEAFEKGRPIGKKVRLGSALDSWYTVVGIVEDAPVMGMGGDDLRRAAVYVSALQNPLRHASLLLRGTEEGVESALRLVPSLGLDVEDAVPLPEVRRNASDAVRWMGRVSALLAVLTLILALHGGHATALQVTRRRVRELAIRRALGAQDSGIVRYVLLGGMGTSLGGSFVAVLVGSLLVGLLRKGAAGVPMLGPFAYAAVAAALVAAGALASLQAAREAVAVEPGAAVE